MNKPSYILMAIKKNLLFNLSDNIFKKYTQFSKSHPEIITTEQVFQKLIIFDFVAPVLKKYSHENILEIGCGSAIHSCLLSEFGKVSATELKNTESWMGDNLEKDRKNIIRSLSKNNISFTYNDGKVLPYPDESFDMVFHNSVIEHVQSVREFNDEVSRILKPGGICISITGAPVLCWYRFFRHYLLIMPLLFPYSLRQFNNEVQHLGKQKGKCYPKWLWKNTSN